MKAFRLVEYSYSTFEVLILSVACLSHAVMILSSFDDVDVMLRYSMIRM